MKLTNWNLALGVALIAGVATYLLYGEFGSAKGSRPVYQVEGILTISQDSGSRKSMQIGQFPELLRERLDAAGWDHSISPLSPYRYDVKVSNSEDTNAVKTLLTTQGHVQFHELYTSMEVKEVLVRLNTLFHQHPVQKPGPDTTGNGILDLIEEFTASENETRRDPGQKHELEFSQPYGDINGSIAFPAEIATLDVTDTARLRDLFNKDTVRQITPGDLQISFAKNRRNPGRDNNKISVYFLKGGQYERSILDNDNILDVEAYKDENIGSYQINIQFDKRGELSWEQMTGRNINRPIAITLDGQVITAPTVLQKISGGSASLSGNFSRSEAKGLAHAIRSSRSPFVSTFERVRISPKSSAGNTSKKIMISGIAFLFFGGLCYFILKALKNN